MAEEIKCPHCNKMNTIHKFCIFCGERLPLDDNQIKLMTDKPEASCLNCGRPVIKGQTKCECGYEFADIECPECQTKNVYTNRFCTNCGEKLWSLDVYDYKYDKIIENLIYFKKLPQKFHNISIYNRSVFGLSLPDDVGIKKNKIRELQSLNLKMNNALCEIRSRWKIVSPDYCINCLGIIKPDEYSCHSCRSDFSDAKKRVEQLQSEINNYAKPIFDYPDSKCTFKYRNYYLGSLAPSIGESQFEYRERLKYEFAEIIIYKRDIKKRISTLLTPKPVNKPETKRYERQSSGGGYCDLSCYYCREECFDEGGGIVGDYDSGGYTEYRCTLGHNVSLGSFCKDYV